MIFGKNSFKKFKLCDYYKPTTIKHNFFRKISFRQSVTTKDSIKEKKQKKIKENVNKINNEKYKKKKNIKVKHLKKKKCGWCEVNNKELLNNNPMKEKLKLCKCKKIYYCCRKHQKNDWKKMHKFHCIANKKKTI